MQGLSDAVMTFESSTDAVYFSHLWCMTWPIRPRSCRYSSSRYEMLRSNTSDTALAIGLST